MKHFVRHYAEMVAAMFAGMLVLYKPAELALSAVGADLDSDAALMLLVLAVTMTLPMVGWMAGRGHRRRAGAEMAAAMLVPAFAAMGLLSVDLVTDAGVLMVAEHVVMLVAMAAVMVLRPAEYTGHEVAG